jgi:SAM-dependent methyltransferase
MTKFADHFSRAAGDYASYRPRYPEALFAWLAARSPDRERAWDCATGSGQAAVALAPLFRTVIATDPSVAQLAHADRRPGVHYLAMTAERPALASDSVALLTVAQALHWFDHDRFYTEARRILRPGGIVAAWSYRLATIDPDVDRIVQQFYSETVGPYWPAERALVDAGYAALPFPFAEVTPPPFTMEARWTLAQWSGYLGTWSAVGRYRTAQGRDPVPDVVEALRAVWGKADETRQVRWPVELRVGMAD